MYAALNALQEGWDKHEINKLSCERLLISFFLKKNFSKSSWNMLVVHEKNPNLQGPASGSCAEKLPRMHFLNQSLATLLP